MYGSIYSCQNYPHRLTQWIINYYPFSFYLDSHCFQPCGRRCHVCQIKNDPRLPTAAKQAAKCRPISRKVIRVLNLSQSDSRRSVIICLARSSKIVMILEKVMSNYFDIVNKIYFTWVLKWYCLRKYQRISLGQNCHK